MRSLSALIATALLAIGAPASAGTNGNHGNPGASSSGDQITAWVLLSSSGDTVASLSLPAGPGAGGITMSCYYFLAVGVGFEPAPDLDAGPVWPPDADTTYYLHCSDPDGDLLHAELLVWDPADPFGALDDSQDARDLALSQLALPQPAVGLAPPAGAHLVGLPSWFWTDTPWVPVEVSAQLGAVTSTVTATPTSLTFDSGDGSPVVVCEGPGVAWHEGAEGPPPCGHTYQTSGTYTVTATITWQVSWTSTTGQGGPLADLATTTTVPVTARQRQAVLVPTP